MIRLFTGIALPAPLKERIAVMAGGVPGAAWQTREQLHLTLRFIGEVDKAISGDVCDALAAIRDKAFSVSLSGVGYFGPPKRAHTLWSGVASNPALIHLRDKIESAMVRLGLAPETRKFHPHVTLARLKNPSRRHLEAFVADHAGFASESFAVQEFHLFSSSLGHGGSAYRIEESYALDGDPT